MEFVTERREVTSTPAILYSLSPFMFFTSYPRDAMLARVIAIVTCLSVRPSVCHEPVLRHDFFAIW